MKLPKTEEEERYPVARATSKFINEQWPFITEEDAYEFCSSLFGQQTQIAEIKIMLWVTKRVLDHKLEK